MISVKDFDSIVKKNVRKEGHWTNAKEKVYSSVQAIRVGAYLMTVSAYSPYPCNFALNHVGEKNPPASGSENGYTTMHHCEHCLAYTPNKDAMAAHMDACEYECPGDIVSDDGVTLIRRIDSAEPTSVAYVQKLCLIARNFLAHKTVLWNKPKSTDDKNHFWYFVMFKRDECGEHLVGYFSVQKRAHGNGRNLSCLLVLPPYQGMGYAKKLIAYSYERSIDAGECGGPERPFSPDGRRVYESYWKSAVSASLRLYDPDVMDADAVAQIALPLGMLFGDTVCALVRIGRMTTEEARKMIDEKIVHALKSHGDEIDMETIANFTAVDAEDVFERLQAMELATKIERPAQTKFFSPTSQYKIKIPK